MTVSVRDSKDDSGDPDTAADDEVNVTITVTDVNEPPELSGSSSIDHPENDTGTVETYTATDPEGATVTWSLSGADSDGFDITGGVLTFLNTPDYEAPTDADTNNVYLVDVLASDGTSTSTLPMTVNVTNVNEDPEFPNTESGNRNIDENTGPGVDVGTPVVATDPDRGDTLTYTLTGMIATSFDIDSSTGQLRTKAPLDHETEDAYHGTVHVHDDKDADGNPDTSPDHTISVEITVTDVNEAPVVTGDVTPEHAENGALEVGTYVADDPEGATTTWDLLGADEAYFSNTDGVLSFLQSPDYEAKNQYQMTVKASDGELTGTLEVTITITNEDEDGAVELSSQQPQVETPLIATLSDPDVVVSGSITWEWESSTSTNSWTPISGATTKSYTPVEGDIDSYLRATATYTDGHGPSKSKEAEPRDSVRAKPPTNAAPEFATATISRSIPENTDAGVNIGDPVTATDDDTGDSLTYSLDETSAEFFYIVASTGQLQTKAPLDREDEDTYTVTVTAADPSNETDTIDGDHHRHGRERVSGADRKRHDRTCRDRYRAGGNLHRDRPGERRHNLDPFWTRQRRLQHPGRCPHLQDTAGPRRSSGRGRKQLVLCNGRGLRRLKHEHAGCHGHRNRRERVPGVPWGDNYTRRHLRTLPPGQNVGAPVRADDPENDDLTYTLSGDRLTVLRYCHIDRPDTDEGTSQLRGQVQLLGDRVS